MTRHITHYYTYCSRNRYDINAISHDIDIPYTISSNRYVLVILRILSADEDSIIGAEIRRKLCLNCEQVGPPSGMRWQPNAVKYYPYRIKFDLIFIFW